MYIMIYIINTILTTSFIFICSHYLFQQIRFQQFKGPLSLPLIGILYDPKSSFIIQYLKSCIKKYGSIFTFSIGMKQMLVVSEPQLVRKILTDTETFIKGPDYTEKFAVVFGEGLVTSNGEKHKIDKRCLGRFFTKNHIEKYNKMICEETDKMIKEELNPNVGTIIDIQDFFHLLSLRIFGKFSMEKDYSLPENQEIAKKINNGVKIGSNIIGSHIIMNMPMFSFFPSIQIVNKIVKYVDEHVNKIINDTFQKMNQNEITKDNILTALIIRHLRDHLGEPLDNRMKQIHDHIRTTLAAGHDTTAFFGCYMAYLLAKHPEVQDKIRNEINIHITNYNYITESDISKLSYCRCVLQEVLRLYTIIPFVNRTNTKPYRIEETNQVIPANTTILIPLTLMNRSDKIWENPTLFNPERFMDIMGHNSAKHGYFPFGYGSRTCIGSNLAITEGMIMMIKLINEFDLYPDPTFKPEIIAGISLISKNGINVRLEKRVYESDL